MLSWIRTHNSVKTKLGVLNAQPHGYFESLRSTGVTRISMGLKFLVLIFFMCVQYSPLSLTRSRGDQANHFELSVL